MQPFGNNISVNQYPHQRFGGLSPLTTGLIGFGLGYLGGELFDGPNGYGPGFGGYGPGFGGYGPGFGGYGPGFTGYGYNGFPGYQGYPGGYGFNAGYKPGLF